jgi:hypothetical protein
METKYTLQRPSRGTGNAGMPTPYNQGFAHAADHLNAGYTYINPYDQPGEEEAAVDFAKGFDAGVWLLSK